ncbi:MAG: hypothetical protein DRH26_17200 [Deltaproteobacteria bacterium]|nr:MAG: hypothetical protein DRH26_17200 [Deltaproteobacteria bacterium]
MATQRQISKQLGLSESLYSMIKNGDRNITYDLAKKLNRITRIEISFWMDAEKEDRKEALNKLEMEVA